VPRFGAGPKALRHRSFSNIKTPIPRFEPWLESKKTRRDASLAAVMTKGRHDLMLLVEGHEIGIVDLETGRLELLRESNRIDPVSLHVPAATCVCPDCLE
jgi:hypothetical protein